MKTYRRKRDRKKAVRLFSCHFMSKKSSHSRILLSHRSARRECDQSYIYIYIYYIYISIETTLTKVSLVFSCVYYNKLALGSFSSTFWGV